MRTPDEARAPAEVRRTLVLTVPDWPAVAAAAEHQIGPGRPVAVLHGGKVIAANAPARSAGVAVGNNKRAVGFRCPEARVVVWDEDVDNRHFSAGVGALEDLVARFTLLSPGTLAIPLDSLKHGYRDEAAAVEALVSALVAETGWEFFPGIADTVFAAVLAAGQTRRVAPGETVDFLAAQPITTLEYAGPEATGLIEVFWQLGLHSLGDLARLEAKDVNARFGTFGRHVHDLASGKEGTLPADHVRGEEPAVELGLDTPTTRSDTLGFLARQLGAELLAKVRRQGLICTQITIELDAAGGKSSTRTWRIEDMQENTIADRLRWQAEGWLAGSGRSAASSPRSGASVRGRHRNDGESAGADDPQSLDAIDDPAPDVEDFSEDGIIALRLIAAELTTPIGATRSLFEENTGQISHTLERLQGLFGPDSVLVPGIQGGWDPAETNLWTPWQQKAVPERSPTAPWPGALHAPRPTTVEHSAVDVLAADGTPVEARPSGLGAAPTTIRFPTGRTETITDYSGSWPIESGWWDPERAVYRTRLQVVTDTGRALLLSKEHGQWYLTGRYR
ncbi:DNA polymerase Y family protein [Brevibacterium spongiae]|uniref:DNA polymerase Y family protein n=1 Tax=Brevibacterium spongiae TaxID=2909672 RepID=A0ABY5SIX6_9MICO|nr:DNA polymerase Y family protein [Brevibacterium spongiae]UVI34417.1 DNA polymerase Y family protein [Brevibacterium spongiae]